MKSLMLIYEDNSLVDYIRWRIDKVSYKITNVDKLENKIFQRLQSYFEYKSNQNISNFRVRSIIGKEIDQALKEHRLQHTVSYSDLAVTNNFGELLEYDPEDEVTDVGQDVLDRTVEQSVKGKIARLASDDFERYVLTAWSLGERSADIAKDLAIHGNHDVAYYKLKVARFKKRFKKKWSKDTFTKFLEVNVS